MHQFIYRDHIFESFHQKVLIIVFQWLLKNPYVTNPVIKQLFTVIKEAIKNIGKPQFDS